MSKPPLDMVFFHLQKTKLEQAVPEIVAKALAQNFRVLIKANDSDELEALDKALWANDSGSFLPHSMVRDAHTAEQPIFLTTGNDNPNNATILFLINGAEFANLEPFTRCCEVFDGTDETIVAAARQKWKDYKDKGYTLTYRQQNDAGKWA
jgi:DNA polymerase-3 subunit chi